MRIHFYTLKYAPDRGAGASVTLEIFIRALIQEGHSCAIHTFYSADNQYTQAPCNIHEEHFNGSFLALQKYIATCMHKTEADIHVLYGPSVLWSGGFYCKNKGHIPVATFINNYTPGMYLQGLPTEKSMGQFVHTYKWRLWEKFFGIPMVRHINAMYFDSPIVENIYHSYGYRGHRNVVIPEPMDVYGLRKIFRNIEPAFMRQAGHTHGLYIGRLTPEKGVSTLIDAMHHAPNTLILHIVGSGPQETALRKRIIQEQLSSKVYFHGWVQPSLLAAYYKAADFFVHPAQWPEPFGRTVGDALTCGLPIITTSHSGSAWVTGKAGLCYKSEDTSALVRALEMFCNPSIRSEYASYTKYIENFDQSHVAKTFIEELVSLTVKS